MSLATLNTDNVANQTVIQPRLYIANDYDPVKVWDGVWSSLRDAGIDAPSAAPGTPSETSGNVTVGTHLIAYYYRDSTSPGGNQEGYGYRSSISSTLSHTVSSTTKKLTFSVGDSGSGADIIRSTDAKVDTIVVVATLAGGEAFFIVGELANSGTTTFEYNVSDTLLTQYTSLTSVGGESAHDAPPCCGQIALVRGIAWAGVFHDADISVDVTNGDATVSGTFSEEWAGRLLTVQGDSRSYRILSVASGGASAELSEAYAGSNATGATATISVNDPNRVYYSRRYYPESFSLATQTTIAMADNDDRIVAITSYLGDPWFLGRRTAQRLVFRTDPNVDGEFVTMSGTCGAWNARCVIKPSADSMYCWGANGVWSLTGGRPSIISKPVDSDWRSLINYDQTDRIHGFYNPEDDEIGWMFCSGTDTQPKRALVYDLSGRRWRIDSYRQAIDASCLAKRSSGRIQGVFSDMSNDMAYTIGGDNDGVPSGDVRLTVDGVGTTTSTSVDEAMPTGDKGTGLEGIVAYSPDLEESVVISDNTTDTITHGAFSRALTDGEKLYLGSIPVEVEFSWWPGQDQSIEKVPEKLVVYCVPSSVDTKLKVYQYRDFSSTAVSIQSMPGRTYPKGVTRGGSDHFLVDLSVSDGYIEIPVGATASKVLKVKLMLDDPTGSMTIMDVQWKPGDRAPGGDGE
jgi:hypothetical protein